METIFEVRRGRRILIRLMMPFMSLLMGVPLAFVGFGALLPGSYEGEFAQSGPYWLGVLFGLVFLLGGMAIAIGAWFYGPAYVTRIEVDRAQETARFSVAGWVRGWAFTVRLDDIVSGRYHDGYLRSGGTVVNAPWTTVRLRGRRLPLIVDAHADADWVVVDRLLEYQALDEPVLVPRRPKKSMKGG